MKRQDTRTTAIALILIAAAMLLLSACTGTSSSQQAKLGAPPVATVIVSDVGLPPGVQYFFDDRRNVHCWTFEERRGVGISCLPAQSEWIIR